MKQNLFFFIILMVASSLFGQITFIKRTLNDALDVAKKFQITDLDNDGDLDLVAAASPSVSPNINVAWYENDGNVVFTRRTISTTFPEARCVDVGDLNGDGYLDVVAGNTGEDFVYWWENDGSPSNGGWIAHSTGVGINDSTYSVEIVDIDDDNDNDILAVFYHGDSLGILKNNGSGTFSFDLLNSHLNGAVDIVSGYIDNDDHLDILSSGYTVHINSASGVITPLTNQLSWWIQNVDHSFGNENSISTTNIIGNGIDLGDLDSDGDLDAIGVGWAPNSELTWWANDGYGNFGNANVIESHFTWGRNVDVVDLDTDGDSDILVASDHDPFDAEDADTIAWYENNGTQTFTQRIISTDLTTSYYSLAADFDGDGDQDIVASSQGDDEIAWWENRSEYRQYTNSGDVSAVSFLSGKVEIDFSAGTADTTRVFYNLYENSDRTSLGSGIHHIATKGFYTIKTEKTGYNCSITFDYTNVSEWTNITDKTDLVICRWDISNNIWVQAGSSQVHDDPNNQITVLGISTELTSFSKWTLGSVTIDNPLPITLSSFKGLYFNNIVKLEWETISEIENLGFEIERSVGNINQELIASFKNDPKLQGAGSTTSKNSYSWKDENVVSDTSYTYFLYNVDFSGKRILVKSIDVSTYESEIPLSFEVLSYYPNPFNGIINIKFKIGYESPNQSGQNIYSLVVYDILGKRIRTLFNNHLPSGTHIVQWDGKNDQEQTVSTGKYTFVLSDGTKQFSGNLLFIK